MTTTNQTKPPKPLPPIEEQALRWLAIRDHSVHELKQKLARKGYTSSDITTAIDYCIEQGWQCNTRYAESYVRSKIAAGHGPLRIKMHLQQQQISEAIINKALPSESSFWHEQLALVWQKKYNGQQPTSPQEYQRQCRFLEGRGFDVYMINDLLELAWR